MFQFLLKKSDDTQEVSKSKISSFERVKEQVMNEDQLISVKGGKQSSRTFTNFFSWNSSCGSSTPQ